MGGLALEALPGGAWSRQVATAHQKAAVVAAAEELFGIRRQNREPWLGLIRLDVPSPQQGVQGWRPDQK